MPGTLLTINSTIQCPHGGRALLAPGQTRVLAGGAPVLLETDIHPVAGCPFTLPGGKVSPCVQIRWSGGAAQNAVGGTPPLVQSSVGLCYSPENAVQGVALIVNTQMNASAR